MIGFDVPEELKDLRKELLWAANIFTGEAKPNVVRLLPSLAIRKEEAEDFLAALRRTVRNLQSEARAFDTVHS
jgi:acetylornithine aminotransferase